MDSLVFLPDSVKAVAELQDSVSVHRDSNPQGQKKNTSAEEAEVEVQVENVERPVDLYKAIFSDDSEDEEEATNIKRQEDQEKTNQAAATTLNRLMAGDFLESLGKELGLEVPPDVVYPETKVLMKEGFKAKAVEEDKSSKGKMEEGSSQNGANDTPELEDTTREKEKEKKNDLESGFKYPSSEDEKSWKKREKLADSCKQTETSEGEQRRKGSKRHRHRSSDTDSDSSSDYWDKYKSRSKEKRKGSCREKSRSRKKHSKHHRRKKSSSSRYSTETDEEREESRKEKRRRKKD